MAVSEVGRVIVRDWAVVVTADLCWLGRVQGRQNRRLLVPTLLGIFGRVEAVVCVFFHDLSQVMFAGVMRRYVANRVVPVPPPHFEAVAVL